MRVPGSVAANSLQRRGGRCGRMLSLRGEGVPRMRLRGGCTRVAQVRALESLVAALAGEDVRRIAA